MKFNRRNLLRGIGAGSLLLAPFVNQRVLRAAAGQPGNLLVFFTPNGFWRKTFGATGAGAQFDFLPSLMPLTPQKSNIAVIRGLSCKSVSDKGSHEEISRILTCMGAGPDGSQPGTPNQDVSSAYGPSIDQDIAKKLNAKALTVGVDPVGAPGFGGTALWNNSLSWRKDGANVTMAQAQKDPKKAFADVFAGLMPSGKPEEVDYTLEKGLSVLDVVKGDIDAMRPRLSTADRNQLDTYLGSIQSIEATMKAPPAVASGICTEENKTALAAATNMGGTGGAVMQANGEKMMDLIATAFACGAARTSTLLWQPASHGMYPADPSGNASHHEITHGNAPGRDLQPSIDTWYANRFLYQLDKLKELGVLDNTMVVWVSEISEEHNQNDYVTVVGGGKDLGLSLGQYIHFEHHGRQPGENEFTDDPAEQAQRRAIARDPLNRSLSDLWVTAQNAMGIPDKTFGEPGVCGGPIVELRPGV